jgi:hypothetical protein
MDCNTAKAALAALIDAKKISFSIVPIAARTDREDGAKSYTQTHYAFTVMCAGAAYMGQYSKGCADILAALKTGYRDKSGRRVPLMIYTSAWPDKDTIQRVLSGKVTPYERDVPLFRAAMLGFATRLPPEPVDIFGSLLSDAAGADVPFVEWAADLGYSDDSISAKRIWETCNDIRRALARMLGPDFERAAELAAEL